MATKLKNLSIEEVSLVDEPANKGARVVLLKRDGMTEKTESAGLLRRLAKQLGLSDDALADVMKNEDDEVAALKKQVKELADKLAKSETERAENLKKADKSAQVAAFRAGLSTSLQKAFDEMDEDEKEEFMNRRPKDKSDPVGKALEGVTKELSSVTKALEAANARVEKLEQERAEANLRVEFKDLEGIVKLDEFVPAYAALAKSDKAAADLMVKNVRTLAKQAKDGGLFKVLGRDGEVAKTSDDKIEAKAAELMKFDAKLTKEQAVAKVLETNPELYTESLLEKGA